MASETPPTPPPLIRIVRSPYDSDDETGLVTSPNSFIHHPVTASEKKQARASSRGGGSKKGISFLDEMSWNATGLHNLGHSVAVHANRTLQTLVAGETDWEERSDSDDSQLFWRGSIKLERIMGRALDRADGYATALCNVVDHVPHGCNGFICGEDDSYSYDSWSSVEDSPRPRRERRSRKKKSKAKNKKPVSSAVQYAYDGNLSDSLSVTSCDHTYDGRNNEEDVSPLPLPTEDLSSSSKKVTAEGSSSSKKMVKVAPCTKASTLRQRREEFMRRKDSKDDAGVVIQRGKRTEIKKPRYVPSQKLRAKYFGSAHHRLIQQNNDGDNDELFGESIPDLESSSNDDSAEKPKSKWQSKSALVDIPVADCIFFTPSHLGPSISRVPPDVRDLQMGDIILRLNGEEVSHERISEMFKLCSGKKVKVSFLRKRMML
jgi:hypothetical protein